MLCTTSSPTPRPETAVTCSLVEKPGRKRKSSSSASPSRRAIAGSARPALDDLGAEPLQVDAAAVVAEDQLEHPGAVAGLQADRAGRGLAGGAALLGRFEAVVQRVADQVVQRGLEPVEDVAVDARGLAGDLEPRLLAQLAGQVADQPGEAADAVGQRAHPAGQHLVVQPAGEVLAVARERLQRLDRLGQHLQAVGGPAPRPGQQLARRPRRSEMDGAEGEAVAAPTPPWPVPVIDRRSSRTCSDSISRDCRSRSRQSASTIGRSRWLCTSASPARPSSRVRLSAVTRTTRSRSRSRSAAPRRSSGAAPRGWRGGGETGEPAAGPLTRAGGLDRRRTSGRGRRPRPAVSGGGCRLRLDPTLLDRVQVGDQGVDLGGVLGLPRRQIVLADPAICTRKSTPRSRISTCSGPEHELALLRRDEGVLHRVRHPDRGIEPDDPRRPLERVRRPHQRLDRLGRRPRRPRAPPGPPTASRCGPPPPCGRDPSARSRSGRRSRFLAPGGWCLGIPDCEFRMENGKIEKFKQNKTRHRAELP